MTREEISIKAQESIDSNKCVILQLATGTGKTKTAIDCANKICDKVYNNEKDRTDILILAEKKPQLLEWMKEIKKWGGIKSDSITFSCYASLHKFENSNFDLVICDEAQHLSERRRGILKTINISYNIICLSATLPKDVNYFLNHEYKTTTIRVNLNDAITANILPDPVIYLLPLEFDKYPTERIIKNGKKNLPVINVSWAERWHYMGIKNREIHIYCNKRQYLDDLNSQIEWYKQKAMSGAVWAKNKWLRLCTERLTFLANSKNTIIISLLEKFKNHRTLTFCNSIEQSEILGKNCIHSKNKLSIDILNKFNSKKIKHITACHILDEGVNLADCKIGIFANINASDIIMIQRCGRLLRHKNPILIIPYYKNTREEELVKKHLADYNKELIITVNNKDGIKL